MNCTSYVPSFYQMRDLSKCESGFSSHPFVFDGKNGEEQGNGTHSSLMVRMEKNMDQHLGYDKVLLSQIMQKHEATFRYQELHRLYRRQRELMDEIKAREMYARHIQLPTSQSNNCLSQTRSEISQTSHTTSWILGDRFDNKLSMLSTDNFRGPSDFVAENFQEPTTAHPGFLLARNCYNRVQAPSFISKGHEMRILNLRLPDSVYHDAEERERFDEVNVSKDSKRDSALCPFKTGDSNSFDVRCRNKKSLIDLNEPIQLESVASSSTSPLEPYPCYLEFSHQNPYVSAEVETGCVVPKLCGHVNYGRDSADRNSSVGIDLNSMPLSCSSETVITQVNLLSPNQEYKVEDPKQHLLSLVEKSDYNSGVPCSFKSKISQASGVDKAVILNTSSVQHELSKEKCVKVDPDTSMGEKLMEFETHIDLNIGVTADETFPSLSSNNVGTKSAGETGMEAPVSPENKEGFPPRGKAKDMLLGTPSLLSERGESKTEIEPDGIAAETLLSISSAIMQDFNLSNCLYWFAEIATGNAEDQEKTVMKLQNGTTNKDGCMLSSDGIDDEFKDTTLRLSQKKALNLSHEVNKDKKRVTLSCRSVKGRTAKDHHTVKPFQRTCSSKRNVGKNSSERPKTHSRSCPSNIKKPMSSILKEPATRSKVGVLQSWGNIKKRQGGPRRRATKFLIIC